MLRAPTLPVDNDRYPLAIGRSNVTIYSMGHCCNAIIGKEDCLRRITERFVNARLVRLRANITMVPITEALYDEISTIHGDSESVNHHATPGFVYLSDQIAYLLAEISKDGAVAYVETEYFGGTGTQGAVAWASGKNVFGPMTSSKLGPINRALAAIGVKLAHGAHDEFDTVGLQFLRNTEEFTEADSDYCDPEYVEKQFQKHSSFVAPKRLPWWKRLFGF